MGYTTCRVYQRSTTPLIVPAEEGIHGDLDRINRFKKFFRLFLRLIKRKHLTFSNFSPLLSSVMNYMVLIDRRIYSKSDFYSHMSIYEKVSFSIFTWCIIVGFRVNVSALNAKILPKPNKPLSTPETSCKSAI